LIDRAKNNESKAVRNIIKSIEKQKAAREEKLKDLLSQSTMAQQFGGTNDDKLQKWSDELQRGSSDGLNKELSELKQQLERLGNERPVQLFSQLRNLQEIRAALQAIGTDTAQTMAGEVDKLLEGVFESSKWSG
jgi:hypothetical protein